MTKQLSPKYLQEKKLIVFDLDGTIVRLKVNWKHLKKLLEEKYYNTYEEHLKVKSISGSLSYIVNRGDEETLQEFLAYIRDYELKNVTQNEPIDETVYFIAHKEEFGISKDTPLAILSLNARETITTSLKQANIYQKIDYIIGREDVRRWKPHPEGLILIQNHFEVPKAAMIYIGDMKKDLITGKNAGVDAFIIKDFKEFVNTYR